MKKLTTVILLLCSTIVLAQHKKITLNESINTETDVKISSMTFTADTVKELESIDWNDVKAIFENNKDEELIKLSFGIDLKKSSNKKVAITGKFSVEGKSENIDDLIIKSKKGINGLIKLYKKYENE
ncbi:hypothetical protein [Polaribacter sp. M15]